MSVREQSLINAIAKVADERDQLRKWVAEVMPILDGLQEMGHALGLPLGEQITGPLALDAVKALKAERDELQARIDQVREIHKDAGPSQGYTATGYGVIEHCCGACGSHGEYGQPWPCPTFLTLS